MSAGGPDLSFDKASFTAGAEAATLPCSQCKQPLEGAYWKVQKFLLCEPCKAKVQGSVDGARSGASFGKALLLGGLTALGCGIAYAVFVQVSSIQMSLLTIGIGYLVARVIRQASRGFSGRKFQVLAVVLTYVAATMGYLPAILKGLQSATASGGPMSPIATVVSFVYLGGVMLAAPFLELTEAPMGVIIIGIGLYEAWRLSRSVEVVFEGPFRVSPAAPPAPTP